MSEFVLAFLMIGVGLSVAGMATHLYQGLLRQPAALRWSGETLLAGVAHLVMSILCGPYLLLRMSFVREGAAGVSPLSVLLGSVIAFSWSFVTGLTLVGTYVALAIAA